MTSQASDVIVRVAADSDIGAIASLRSLWSVGDEPDFERRMAAWLAAEGERRTTWLAALGDMPVGMASLFEYRRMPRPNRPDSRWATSATCTCATTSSTAGSAPRYWQRSSPPPTRRSYARLVVSPNSRAVAFYRRGGFVVANNTAGADILLVRPSQTS
jgi:hypothetical protein